MAFLQTICLNFIWKKQLSGTRRLFLQNRYGYLRSLSSSARTAAKACSETVRLDVPESPLETAHLENGMRLICECKDFSCVTTVGCFLAAGSLHEKPEERGASLLMEHLTFRRTKCRSQEDIAGALDRIGGKLEALATRDMFLFYGSAPSCHVESIIELLSDVILNGIICEEDTIAARSMILRELAEMELDKERVVMDYLPMIAYQNSDLSKSVYPDTCALKNIQVQNVESFKNRLFKPSLMTMISTGGTSFFDFESLAGEYLIGREKSEIACSRDCTIEDISCTRHYRFTGSEIRLRDDDESLAHVALAVEGPGHTNCQDHCTLTVAKEIVGCWDMTNGGSSHNAPYLAHCAFNSDMCHLYKSFNIGWAQTSLWGCYFVCEKLQQEDMIWMLQNEWMRLCSTITSKEVSRAVNQAKTSQLVRINDSVDRFFDIATSLYRRGCYQSLNERLARYDRVTVESLREVANKYIYDQCPAIVAIGPIENLPDYNRIRSYMYRIRH